MGTFIERLEAQWAAGKYLCVGLDPKAEKLLNAGDMELFAGASSQERAQMALGLCVDRMASVVDATRHIAACFKPNWAFYLRYGAQGLEQLARLIKYIHAETDVPVILDCKAGDIGDTNEEYAAAFFDYLGADAITINPYLGWVASRPFLDRADRGIFVLCRTTNPGAGEFQDLPVEIGSDRFARIYQGQPVGEGNGGFSFPTVLPLYQYGAVQVANQYEWNYNGNCGLVTGGTYPDEIAEIRKLAPDTPLLIPGIGKQGGDLVASIRAARHRFLVNVSSAICLAADPGAAGNGYHRQIEEARATCAA